jgi:hypothetical protein
VQSVFKNCVNNLPSVETSNQEEEKQTLVKIRGEIEAGEDAEDEIEASNDDSEFSSAPRQAPL